MLRKVEALKASQKGREFGCEWEEVEDAIAGKRVVRFTSSMATDQHPYFTGPAVTEAAAMARHARANGQAGGETYPQDRPDKLNRNDSFSLIRS